MASGLLFCRGRPWAIGNKQHDTYVSKRKKHPYAYSFAPYSIIDLL